MRLLLVDASHLVASERQELHEMMQQIEALSEAGRDLMRDVHPQVGEIKEHVETVKEAVSPDDN